MTSVSEKKPLAELEAGVDHVRDAPKNDGVVRLVVRRPAENEREVLDEATLDPAAGLLGDTWLAGSSGFRDDGTPDPSVQLTLMNARSAALIAGAEERWPAAGDQLYVDLSLSTHDLPPGTRLAVGSALIEISHEPHRGCGKFSARFGLDALRFVNSRLGRELNLRGVNARILESGVVRPGDAIRKAPAPEPQAVARSQAA
jgi:hypothetical protein